MLRINYYCGSLSPVPCPLTAPPPNILTSRLPTMSRFTIPTSCHRPIYLCTQEPSTCLPTGIYMKDSRVGEGANLLMPLR